MVSFVFCGGTGAILNFFISEKAIKWGIDSLVVHLTLVREVASSSPTAGSLTQPSILLWVSKMSTWQMMAIGRICAFQIGSLHQLGNQDMAALVLYAPQGVDLRGGGSSSERNDTVKGLSQGVKFYCKAPLI